MKLFLHLLHFCVGMATLMLYLAVASSGAILIDEAKINKIFGHIVLKCQIVYNRVVILNIGTAAINRGLTPPAESQLH